jgi:ABC-type multidrug transport system fused ATPase/permease subunit
MSDLELGEDTSQESNYPIEEDTAFTPDEISAIKAYKDNLNRKLSKNRSILKGLETSFWGITSYSLARFLILTSGTQGIALAVASILLINQITNREVFDGININRKDGQWSADNMGKLIKFGFSTLVTAFVMWSALGNFLNIVNSSKQTYNQLQDTVTAFNKLPSDKQNGFIVVGGLLVLAGIYTIIDSKRR